MNHTFDYIIQGAGASGLWLAYGLMQEGLLNTGSLLIVESNQNKVNDRTWCFWDSENSAVLPFVNRSWTNFQVQGEIQKISPYRYCHSRSEDFYAWVKQALSGYHGVTWLSGFCGDPKAIDNGVEVIVGEQVFQSKWFFYSGFGKEAMKNSAAGDSFGNNLLNDSLWQSFVGWRVKSKESIFDGLSATLMDFSIEQQGTTRFLYVLPTSNREGLIELTQFDLKKLSASEGERVLKEICIARNWEVEVLELEHDAIPMTSALDVKRPYHNSSSRIIPLGAVAGALKPTTGYGFLRMRNHGMAVAKALKAGRDLPTLYRLPRFQFYDRLLLRILKEYPSRGKDIFNRLFSAQKATLVLKFLDEKTTIWEEMGIFLRLQVGLFLKVLIKYNGK